MGAIRSYFRRTSLRGSIQLEITRAVNRLLLATHNCMLIHGTLLQGTTTTKVKTTTQITYTADGVFLTKAITDDLFSLALAAFGLAASTPIQPGYTQKVWLGLDAAGAATAYEGTQKLTANLAGDPVKLDMAYPDGIALVGTVTIANASGAAVTPGTVVLATGGGVTITITNGVDTGALPLVGELSQQISL